MRRIAGTLLMALAGLCAAGTLFIAGVAIIEMWRTRPTADTHVVAFAGLLLSGALLALAAILFLTGRSLRQPRALGAIAADPPSQPPAAAGGLSGGQRWDRAGGRAGICGAAFRFAAVDVPDLTSPLSLAELLVGGVLGLDFGSEPARQAILASVNCVYFVALFYPVYSLVVLDRTAEVVRYQRMKTLGILFGTMHLLIGLAFVAMMRA